MPLVSVLNHLGNLMKRSRGGVKRVHRARVQDHRTRPAVWVPIAVACTLLGLIGCDEALQRERITWHPITDSLSVDMDRAIRISREGSLPAIPALGVYADRLRRRVMTATIGRLEGDPDYLFGRVVDSRFLADGSIAVLDQQAQFLRVYDSNGVHLYSVGGPGEGPGELDVPVALVSPSPQEVWVVEAARKIHRYREESGELRFVDQILIDSYSVRDACSSAESTILHIPSHVTQRGQTESSVGEVLHRYDNDGTRRGSFAVPYRYSPRMAAERMKRGFVSCPSAGVVVLGYEYQNRLDAYGTSDGQLLWHATFEGIGIPPLREGLLPDGRRSVGTDVRGGEATYHFLLGVSGGTGTPVIVQFGRREREDVLNRVDRYVVETFLVDPISGEGLYFGEDLPQVLSVEDERIALLRVDPFLMVELARLPE